MEATKPQPPRPVPNAPSLIQTTSCDQDADDECVIYEEIDAAAELVVAPEPAAAEPVPPRSPVYIMSDDDESLAPEESCMICMDAPPDTCVLPCMHKVVCERCSKQLETKGGFRPLTVFYVAGPLLRFY